jgi:HAD superfamily hydrolase (TIGR01509 family)
VTETNHIPRAVIWDLDGTLIDSHGAHHRAWAQVTSEYGIPFSQQKFEQTFGMHNHAVLSLWLGDRWTQALEDEIAARKEQLYRAAAVEDVGLFPGALHWLETLKRAGWRQGLGSSAPWANIDALLEPLALDGYLEVVRSGENFPSKPDPALFLDVARALGVKPARCVVVEDAPSGVEAARRGGMRAVGVATTHEAEKLGDADEVFASLEALPPDLFDRFVPGGRS